MRTLMLNPTDISQWMALVSDAESACGTHLEEDLKSYLVFLLMRYTGDAELAGSVMALEYLRGLGAEGRVREERLSKVGDKCLLFSGLFPGRAERRRVRVSYYVDLGAAAYHFLAQRLRGARAGLYQGLASGFVSLMDILHATRELGAGQPALQPLQALEIWSDTGSRHAYATLRRYTRSTPLAGATLPSAYFRGRAGSLN